MNRDLTPEERHVIWEKGTEVPFSGAFWNAFEPGTYRCKACGTVLFLSANKYDAGCGWPSFDREASTGVVATAVDDRYGTERTEITCERCGAHLGHVFDDGPKETTGKRYCVNSLSLDFEPEISPTG